MDEEEFEVKVSNDDVYGMVCNSLPLCRQRKFRLESWMKLNYLM